MLCACFLVVVTAVRSQDSYGSPTSSALSLAPEYSRGVSSGSGFSPSNSQNNFHPSNFQKILGSGGASSSVHLPPVYSSPESQKSFAGGSQSDLFASALSLFSSTSSDFTQSGSTKQTVRSTSKGSSTRRSGGSNGETFTVPGGIDFSKATRTEDGRLCIIKEESVDTLSKDPILECTHKNVEQCHYTYITYFKPSQERTCEENFEKICQITFTQKAIRETVKKCYKPVEKVCDSKEQPQYSQPQTGYGQPQQGYGSPEDTQAPQECRTVFESSCTTKYIEKSPGKFVADTKCEKLPLEICGQGCTTKEGPEECHNKDIDTLVDVPEESCDLNPQKTCRMMTKLVPSLKPKQECTMVPKETCNLKFTQPKIEKKPLITEWCLEEDSEEPENTYGGPQPSYDSSDIYNAPEPSYDAPEPSYNAPEPTYNAPEPAYNAPEPIYNTPEPTYDAPKSTYNAPESTYGGPDPSFNSPEPSYDEPKQGYSSPLPANTRTQPSYRSPQIEPKYDSPQPSYSSPQPSFRQPQNNTPQSQFSASQPIYRSNARSGRRFG